MRAHTHISTVRASECVCVHRMLQQCRKKIMRATEIAEKVRQRAGKKRREIYYTKYYIFFFSLRMGHTAIFSFDEIDCQLTNFTKSVCIDRKNGQFPMKSMRKKCENDDVIAGWFTIFIVEIFCFHRNVIYTNLTDAILRCGFFSALHIYIPISFCLIRTHQTDGHFSYSFFFLLRS